MLNSSLQVFVVAGSGAQRHALEHLLDGVPGVRNLGSGNLNGAVPTHADVILAEVVAGESPQQSLQGPPYWLALVDEVKAHWVVQGLRQGLRGLLPRRSHEAQVEAALGAVAQGLMVIHPEYTQPSLQPETTPLSGREQEVLAMLGLGRSNKEIAGQLSISEHTVKFHLASIFQKLNATSRSQAVATGLRRGLVWL